MASNTLIKKKPSVRGLDLNKLIERIEKCLGTNLKFSLKEFNQLQSLREDVQKLEELLSYTNKDTFDLTEHFKKHAKKIEQKSERIERKLNLWLIRLENLITAEEFNSNARDRQYFESWKRKIDICRNTLIRILAKGGELHKLINVEYPDWKQVEAKIKEAFGNYRYPGIRTLIVLFEQLEQAEEKLGKYALQKMAQEKLEQILLENGFTDIESSLATIDILMIDVKSGGEDPHIFEKEILPELLRRIGQKVNPDTVLRNYVTYQVCSDLAVLNYLKDEYISEIYRRTYNQLLNEIIEKAENEPSPFFGPHKQNLFKAQRITISRTDADGYYFGAGMQSLRGIAEVGDIIGGKSGYSGQTGAVWTQTDIGRAENYSFVQRGERTNDKDRRGYVIKLNKKAIDLDFDLGMGQGLTGEVTINKKGRGDKLFQAIPSHATEQDYRVRLPIDSKYVDRIFVFDQVRYREARHLFAGKNVKITLLTRENASLYSHNINPEELKRYNP